MDSRKYLFFQTDIEIDLTKSGKVARYNDRNEERYVPFRLLGLTAICKEKDFLTQHEKLCSLNGYHISSPTSDD